MKYRGRTRSESSPGRTADRLSSPQSCPKRVILQFSISWRFALLGRKESACRAVLPLRGSRCPPAAAAVPAGGQGAPHLSAPLRAAGLPRRPAPAAAEAGLEPSTKNASKRRRGQTQTRGSFPATNRVPAGSKRLSRGRPFYAGIPRPRR